MNTENNEMLGLIIEELTRIRTMLKTNSSTVNLAIGDLEACTIGLKKIYEENSSIPSEEDEGSFIYAKVEASGTRVSAM